MIDPRGPRFGAILTTVLLAAALLTGSGWVLAVAAVLFAVGAARGVQHTPYAWLFRHLVRPRLGHRPISRTRGRPGSRRRSDWCSPRSASSARSGWPALFYAATGLALAAALLNAAFGYCLGCELYLLLRRVRPARSVPFCFTPTNEEDHPHEPYRRPGGR